MITDLLSYLAQYQGENTKITWRTKQNYRENLFTTSATPAGLEPPPTSIRMTRNKHSFTSPHPDRLWRLLPQRTEPHYLSDTWTFNVPSHTIPCVTSPGPCSVRHGQAKCIEKERWRASTRETPTTSIRCAFQDHQVQRKTLIPFERRNECRRRGVYQTRRRRGLAINEMGGIDSVTKQGSRLDNDEAR
jgi:hypothetical protein